MKSSFLVTLSVALSVALSLIAGAAEPLKVGVVFDKGGKDDKSFNQAAFEGLKKAKAELGVETKYVEATDDNAFEPMLRALAQKKYDLVFGIGFSQAEAVKKVAAQFPDQKFVIVDSDVPGKNVKSILFEEHLGSYLVGAAAALATKSGKIGFIGGMDIPLIRRFEKGFQAGVQKINPGAKVVSNFVGVTGEAWNNPAKAKELGLGQYATGVDIVFAAAGASNSGVFDAAEEKKGFAIGVDSNQNWVKPGRILTSMLKRVDVAVFETIRETQDGKFKPGLTRMGLADKGIDYALDQYNEKLFTADMKKKVDELKKQILAGKIQVPDYYVMMKK